MDYISALSKIKKIQKSSIKIETSQEMSRSLLASETTSTTSTSGPSSIILGF
jgi:hypothetical protein